MEVLDAIRERYSVRGYTDEKLSPKEIEALLTAGLQAPTATNRQEIHFTVLDGSSELIREIEAEKNGGKDAPVNFYYDAPTVIILSAEADFRWLNGPKKDYFAEKLKFPKDYEFKIAIALGHKNAVKEPHGYSLEKNVSFI